MDENNEFLKKLKKKVNSELDNNFDKNSIAKKIEKDIENKDTNALMEDVNEVRDAARKTVLRHPIKSTKLAVQFASGEGEVDPNAWKDAAELGKEALNQEVPNSQPQLNYAQIFSQQIQSIEPYKNYDKQGYALLQRQLEALQKNPSDVETYNNAQKLIDTVNKRIRINYKRIHKYKDKFKETSIPLHVQKKMLDKELKEYVEFIKKYHKFLKKNYRNQYSRLLDVIDKLLKNPIDKVILTEYYDLKKTFDEIISRLESRSQSPDNNQNINKDKIADIDKELKETIELGYTLLKNKHKYRTMRFNTLKKRILNFAYSLNQKKSKLIEQKKKNER